MISKASFSETFHNAADKQSPLCIGIDPSNEVFKKFGLDHTIGNLRKISFTIAEAIISSGVVLAKPNIAFFERFKSEGVKVYEDVIQHLEQKGVLVIRDVKRGDIGSTCEAYAKAHLPVDTPIPPAMTAIAYMGLGDGIGPVISRAKEVGGCTFIVVHSSNVRGEILQSAIIKEENLTIAQYLCKEINNCNQENSFAHVGAVIGATLLKEQITKSLELLGTTALILVPGIGAQGGTLNDIKINFAGHEKQLIPVISRSVMDKGTTVEKITQTIWEYKQQAWALRMGNQQQNLVAGL